MKRKQVPLAAHLDGRVPGNERGIGHRGSLRKGRTMKRAGIQRIEAAYLAKDRPEFCVGDTADVGVRIMEGDKERIQVFTGLVIARRGGGATETFTVRRLVAGEGVERTFPLHSPHLAFIRVIRSGKVRRAKLYYLRQRVGKATRLAERQRELELASGTATPQEGPPPSQETAPSDEAGA